MKQINKMTPNEITKCGIDALRKELGIMGYIKFIQQFNLGSGNYTKDRHKLLKGYDVKKIIEKISK